MTGKKKAGRPSKYTEKLGKQICELIAEGESVRKISLKKGMPSAWTIHNWVSNNPDFSQQYAHARDIQRDYYLDLIEDLCFACPSDNTEVQRVRLITDRLMWKSCKLFPRELNDRLVEKEHGADDQKDQTLNLKIIDIAQ